MNTNYKRQSPDIRSLSPQKLEAHCTRIAAIQPDARRLAIECELWPEYRDAFDKARWSRRAEITAEFNDTVAMRMAEEM